MKLFTSGEKGRALCDRDGLVSTTYRYRDVPFSDGQGQVRDILVGVCDRCDRVLAIPPQSTPAIGAERARAQVPVEATLPAPYIEILDAAGLRVHATATPDFRKRLLVYYVDRYASGAEKMAELATLAQRCPTVVMRSVKPPRKRLSFKLAPKAHQRFEDVARASHLDKTTLIKSLVVKINDDIVEPARPRHLAELSTLADVFYA
jgi:hypothetical protein